MGRGIEASECKTKRRDQGRTQARPVSMQGNDERRGEGGSRWNANFQGEAMHAKAHGGDKKNRSAGRLT